MKYSFKKNIENLYKYAFICLESDDFVYDVDMFMRIKEFINQLSLTEDDVHFDNEFLYISILNIDKYRKNLKLMIKNGKIV